MTKIRKKMFVLTLEQRVCIVNWLVANKERLHEQRPSFTKVAGEMKEMFNLAEDLDPRVLKDMMDSCPSLGLLWEPNVNRVGNTNTARQERLVVTQRLGDVSQQVAGLTRKVEGMETRIQDDAVRITTLEAHMATLTGVLNQICTELGIKLKPGVLAPIYARKVEVINANGPAR